MTESKRLSIYTKYDGHCAYCGRKIKQKAMTVDHLMPQSKGGGNGIENLMPSCRECNHAKGADIIETFRLRFFWDSLKPSELVTYDKMVSAMKTKHFYFETLGEKK